LLAVSGTNRKQVYELTKRGAQVLSMRRQIPDAASRDELDFGDL